MNEHSYRARLRADLEKWVSSGSVPPSAADAIRTALGPDPERAGAAIFATIAGVVLVGAALLVFVASNWQGIPRVGRLALLLGSIVGAFGVGAVLSRLGKERLADLAATFGTVAFCGSIALVGQMYHLPQDMAGGSLLMAGGALLAALLTSSRGALAVAAFAGAFWTTIVVNDMRIMPHLGYAVFWLPMAGLALAWQGATARHIAVLCFGFWWLMLGVNYRLGTWDLSLIEHGLGGATLALGLGALAQTYGRGRVADAGATFFDYGCFGLMLTLAFGVGVAGHGRLSSLWPWWIVVSIALGLLGLVIALVQSANRLGLATLLGAWVLVFFVMPFEAYALPKLVYGGLATGSAVLMLLYATTQERRPRYVAAWLGFGGVVMMLTWAFGSGLLDRAILLALAGLLTIGIAALLKKFKPAEGGLA